MATTTNRCRVVAIIALVLYSLASCCVAASAPSLAPESSSAAAPSPAEDPCLIAIYKMSDCLSFVEDGSNMTKPDKGCCPEVAELVHSNPICLCKLLSKPDAIGIKIDLNQALKLPSVCGVTTPPVSKCSALGYPVSLSPSESPSMAPDGSTMSSPSPGGAGPSSDEAAAGASPSGSKSGNGASSGMEAPSLAFLFGLATIFF